MPVSSETSQKLSEAAKSRPRDARGHFIKAGTDPASTVARTVTSSTPIPIMTNPPKLSTNIPLLPNSALQNPTPKSTSSPSKKENPLDAPLVVINNPFKALLHWLDDIRRKQTTTFDLKISVPLIALPIFLVVVGGALQYMFTLGKQSATTNQITPVPTKSALQTPVLISKVGIIKGTYRDRQSLGDGGSEVLADEVTPTSQPTPSNTPIPPTSSPTPTPTFTPTPTLTPTPTPDLQSKSPPSRFVLVDKDEKIFFLNTPKTLSLNKYLNQRVLITGMYDEAKETITIKKVADIEVLP